MMAGEAGLAEAQDSPAGVDDKNDASGTDALNIQVQRIENDPKT